ncbi:hypothetical protein V8C26DRAFT_384613 [Trichoderma gracile]
MTIDRAPCIAGMHMAIHPSQPSQPLPTRFCSDSCWLSPCAAVSAECTFAHARDKPRTSATTTGTWPPLQSSWSPWIAQDPELSCTGIISNSCITAISLFFQHHSCLQPCSIPTESTNEQHHGSLPAFPPSPAADVALPHPPSRPKPSNQTSQRPRRVESLAAFSPSCASQEASAAGTDSLLELV